MRQSQVDIDGEIDAGFTSYWDGGETVGVAGDENGDVEFDHWPADVDPEDLTETQREVIGTVAMSTDASQADVADKVGCSAVNVKYTLDNYWPEGLSRLSKAAATNPSGKTQSDLNCGEIRQRVLDTNSAYEVAKEVGVSRQTLRHHARGDCACDSDVPALTYDGEEWVRDVEDEEPVPKDGCTASHDTGTDDQPAGGESPPASEAALSTRREALLEVHATIASEHGPDAPALDTVADLIWGDGR